MSSVTEKPRIAPSLDACVEAEMEEWDVPGVAVAVLQDGALDARSYGVTSLETSQPVSVNTLFQIGSITKVFTATLIMRLVEANQLNLDEPIITYLPDLQLADEVAQQTITLRHLLSHSSGLFGDYFEDFGTGDDALSRYAAHMHTLRQITPPGELWFYGNSGFNLAGAVVEKVLETSFEEAMRGRIFEPLHMDRSFMHPHEAIAYPVAVGHTKDPEGELEINRRYPLPRSVGPAGGIISTVEDVMKFAQMHLNNGRIHGRRILKDANVREMQEPQIKAGNFAEHYGIGWAISSIRGERVIGHGGTTGGFKANLAIIPERQFAIVTLANSRRGGAAIRRIEEWAFEYYCGLKPEQPERKSTTRAALQRFEGEYRQPYSDITVEAKYNRIVVDIVTRSPLDQKETKEPTINARPIDETQFWITEGLEKGETIEFIFDQQVEDENAPPSFIRFHGRLADRIEPEPETEAEQEQAEQPELVDEADEALAEPDDATIEMETVATSDDDLEQPEDQTDVPSEQDPRSS